MASIFEWYEELKGSRANRGELTIPDFPENGYDVLYKELIEDLAPFIGGDYYTWYGKQCVSYHRHKKGYSVTYDFYDPHREIPIEFHSIRMQLSVLKFYLWRRVYSRYGKKE